MLRPLYGGAITCTVPDRFADMTYDIEMNATWWLAQVQLVELTRLLLQFNF